VQHVMVLECWTMLESDTTIFFSSNAIIDCGSCNPICLAMVRTLSKHRTGQSGSKADWFIAGNRVVFNKGDENPHTVHVLQCGPER
jgi:hypothetical protein